jgi:hypothetical protein
MQKTKIHISNFLHLQETNENQKAPTTQDLCVCLWASLSLGDTIKNITPQISKTHPTLEQHKTHIKQVSHSKSFIKRLPKSFKIQIFN